LPQNIYTVLIGGKAGEGIKKSAQVIALLAVRHQNNVFQNDDYQSLIKGGHNFSVVSMSGEAMYNCYKSADLIVSFDKRSVEKHISEISERGLHFCDEADADIAGLVCLPLRKLVKEHYPEDGNMSMAPIAIFCAVLDISEDMMLNTIASEFKHNIPQNQAFAQKLYGIVRKMGLYCPYTLKQKRTIPQTLYTGNQLIALGAWAAGLDYYFGYPMTPASSILHYLAKKSDRMGVITIHAESELAAANMALGACFAGKRAAVGSSGGGFALMQEAFSMAGMVEAPLLCFLSSRPGPATGVSTYTAQEDLNFALHQGHGEFPRILASPDSFERAFSLATELMNLAWESQSPAILLTEKHLSECMTNVTIPLDSITESQVNLSADDKYLRYKITESGVSPLRFPGKDNCSEDDVIKWNTNEHVESGVRTDDAEAVKRMKEKRLRKLNTINELSQRYERVMVYGSGKPIVFAYGSTALELREAMKYIDFTLVVPIYLEPFPYEELQPYQDSEAIVVEHSIMPNFAKFLSSKMALKVKANILRYDGRQFSAEELVKAIREADNA